MTPMTPEHIVVRLERAIPAPPHKVYRAWLDPDLLRRWLAPGGLEVTRVEIDERVGGHYRVWQADSGSDVGGFDCELLELVPDQRIVYRWGFVGPERRDGPAYDSLLTITLRETPKGATLLTLVHERLEELAAAMPHVAENVEPGWDLVLEKLTATVGER
ncbi:MAG TPA: SRPBCC domain-containing protein [Ktedonobacterales bacterium]